MKVVMRPIDAIIVGERARKDMGDIPAFAADIARRGLLEPIGVKPDDGLIFGGRRLAAARHLGWKEIACAVHDIDDVLGAEWAENEQRKSLAPSEKIALGREIERAHKERIKAQEATRKAHGPKTMLNQLSQEPVGPARLAAASALGMSEFTYHQAKAVVEAADTDPARFGDLPQKMDKSRNVASAHREMERRKAGAAPDPKFTGKRPKRKGVRGDKTAPYQPTTQGQRNRAHGQKRRIVNCVSTMHGVSTGLDALDVPMALSVSEDEERKAWIKQLREIMRSARGLLSRLEAKR